MDTTTTETPHALSGHNPTLFNVVLQYADMDMLRALVLTSQSMYETLQHCRFDHLTMVVLEAPILEDLQQVVYNGADPVPSDTFHLPLNNVMAAPLVEMSSSTPPPQTQNLSSTLLDNRAFNAWQRRSVIRNDFDHDIILPEYARNFMARAQSVELIVYRRRLGTRISTFFNNNAHRLKHNLPFASADCPSCSESPTATTLHKLHLACPLTPHPQHCHTNNEKRRHDDSECIFTKHASHEYFEGDAAESRRWRFHMSPANPGCYPGHFPLGELPPLQLKFPHNRNANTKHKSCAKRKRHTDNARYRDGHFYIATDDHNTRVYCPRFQNGPFAEQYTLATSLKIHIVDCVCFGVEDWVNATPGCTIQPIQTWIIHDDTSAPHHRHHSAKRMFSTRQDTFYERDANYDKNSKDDNNIDRHFPNLTSLVLQYTRLDEANQCGNDQLDSHKDTRLDLYTRLSHFFIDNDVNLPHLQRFDVVGTLLDISQYTKIIFYNARTSSVNINPGHQPTSYRAIQFWIDGMCRALDHLEDSTTLSSSSIAAEDFGQEDAATAPAPHYDVQRYVTHRDPSWQPRRKYNFSIDFASSCLESCCPHKTHILTQRTLPNTHAADDVPNYRNCSQFDQHLATCATIHNALSNLYRADRNGGENTYYVPLSELRMLVAPNSPFRRRDVSVIIVVARLAQRTLTRLELRCHYCSHANPGSTLFPGAPSGDCTATKLPPSVDGLMNISDLPLGDDDEGARPWVCNTQPDEEMYMRLRQLLHIPPHVVLRL